MELKQRKRLINSALPQYEGGKYGFNFQNVFWHDVNGKMTPYDGFDQANVQWHPIGDKMTPFLGTEGQTIQPAPIPLQIPTSINAPDKIDIASKLPTQKPKASLTGVKAGNIITSAVDFTGSAIDAFSLDRNKNQIMYDAGQRDVNAGGFTWQRNNDINQQRELDELRKQNTNNTLNTTAKGAALGAAVGSIFPGAGTILGGVIGGVAGAITGFIGGASRKHKLRKRMFNAQQQISRNNNYNLASAQGDYLDQTYDINHQYTQDDQIYVAKYGKACGGLMELSK